jgi:hypothetical protein
LTCIARRGGVPPLPSRFPWRPGLGEWRGGFLLASPPEGEPALQRTCAGWPIRRLGSAGGTKLKVTLSGRILVDEPVDELDRLRENGLRWLSGA